MYQKYAELRDKRELTDYRVASDTGISTATLTNGYKDADNRRNGYISKQVKTSYGEIPIEVPRDRQASFEPQIVPKRTRDVSGIEDKVMSMYARGMSQRDIADTIEEIYGFEISHENISSITDRVIETVDEWQNRPLKKFYTLVFYGDGTFKGYRI